jgi:hypothetical protein
MGVKEIATSTLEKGLGAKMKEKKRRKEPMPVRARRVTYLVLLLNLLSRYLTAVISGLALASVCREVN